MPSDKCTDENPCGNCSVCRATKDEEEYLDALASLPAYVPPVDELKLLIDAIWPGCPKDTPFEHIRERAIQHRIGFEDSIKALMSV